MSEQIAAPPSRPEEPAFNAPPVTIALIVAIVGMFVLLRLMPDGFAAATEGLLSLVPARVALAVADPLQLVNLIVVFSLFSHALLHVDLMPLGANAGFLLAFGSVTERALGGRRYLLLLLMSVLAGAAAQLLVDWGRWISLLGASAAASGCMAAVVRLLLNDRSHDGRRRKLALALMGVVVLVNLVFAVLGPEILPIGAEIAWEAHLGGFAAGYLLSGAIGRRT